jgi:Flp pilus assembly protein TadB
MDEIQSGKAAEIQPGKAALADLPMRLLVLLKQEWPYFLVLVLALFGIAYTSISRTSMSLYWIALAPLAGVICVATQWHDKRDKDERLRLIWTQTLHWTAVLVAMHLLFVSDVRNMMNADASALALLTLLALGTFTAGVHIRAWRLCFVGFLLAVGVPGIAWLEQSALFLLFVGLILIAVIGSLLWRGRARPTLPQSS